MRNKLMKTTTLPKKTTSTISETSQLKNMVTAAKQKAASSKTGTTFIKTGLIAANQKILQLL